MQLESRKFKSILDARPGIKKVKISGGEPFLHPELRKILEFCVDKKLQIGISTSATVNIDLAMISSIASQTSFNLQVHVPAASESVFNSITNSHSLFGKMISNLHSLTDILGKGQLQMRTTIFRGNYTHLQSILDLAHLLQIPLHIALMIPVLGNQAEKITSEEVANLSFFLAAQRIQGLNVQFSSGETICRLLVQEYGLPKKKGADCKNTYVDSRGNIHACEFDS